MFHFVINVKSVRFIPNTKHGKPDIVVTALASEQIGVQGVLGSTKSSQNNFRVDSKEEGGHFLVKTLTEVRISNFVRYFVQ